MEMIGLRAIRKKKKLSQLKVAMDLNISREALSLYETGKRNPGNEMLIQMSRYFNVSIDYLILGHEFIPLWELSSAYIESISRIATPSFPDIRRLGIIPGKFEKSLDKSAQQCYNIEAVGKTYSIWVWRSW